MKAIVKQSPRHLLEAFCKRYSVRDMGACLALFTKDVLLWGTGFDEIRRGLPEVEEQLKRDWSQSESCQFEIEHIEEDPDNPHWVSGAITAHIKINGVFHTLTLRGTLITRLENGINKIRFCHTSFPASNQPIGESFPTI